MEIKDLNDKIDAVLTAQEAFQTELKAGNEANADRANADITKLTDELTEIKTAMARSKVENMVDTAAEERKQYGEAIRAVANGTFESKAEVLNTIVAAEGGLVVPPSLETAVIELLREATPARQYMSALSLSSADYNFNMQSAFADGAWAEEMDVRSDTNSPEFKRGKITAHDLFSYTTLSDVMIEDAGFDIQSYVNADVTKTWAVLENEAFVNGSGVGKPKGLVEYVGETEDAQIIKAFDIAGAALSADDLVDVMYDVKPQFLNGACWVMNRVTLAAVRKLKDADGNFLFDVNRQLDGTGVIGTILGIKVIQDESVSHAAVGDVAAYFGNLAGYTIFDRQGTHMVHDSVTRPGFQKLYTRKRVGGGLVNGQGIRAIRRGA